MMVDVMRCINFKSETPHRHFENGGKEELGGKRRKIARKEELFNLVITFAILHPFIDK